MSSYSTCYSNPVLPIVPPLYLYEVLFLTEIFKEKLIIICRCTYVPCSWIILSSNGGIFIQTLKSQQSRDCFSRWKASNCSLWVEILCHCSRDGVYLFILVMWACERGVQFVKAHDRYEVVKVLVWSVEGRVSWRMGKCSEKGTYEFSWF